MSTPDYCAMKLSRLAAGDIVTVGRTRWQVFRNRGVTNYITKEGSKGRKLYTLHATSLDPCCIEVREVFGGSGDLMDKPAVARGCAPNLDAPWAGARRRR